MFHQQLKICHWWFFVDCESSGQFYNLAPRESELRRPEPELRRSREPQLRRSRQQDTRRPKRNNPLPPGHRYNYVIDKPRYGSRRMMRKIKRRYYPRRRVVRRPLKHEEERNLENEIASIRNEIQRLLTIIY